MKMKITVKGTETGIADFITLSVELETEEDDAEHYNTKWIEYIKSLENFEEKIYQTAPADMIIEELTRAAIKAVKKAHEFMSGPLYE